MTGRIPQMARLGQLSEQLDLATLPPEVRARLRDELVKLLHSIGVTPRINRKTGDLIVPLEEMCRALGMSEAEARETLGDAPDCLVTTAPDEVGYMQ